MQDTGELVIGRQAPSVTRGLGEIRLPHPPPDGWHSALFIIEGAADGQATKVEFMAFKKAA
jgi:hypothetical protein